MLTTAEVARELGVTPSRIRHMVLSGRLMGVRRGRDVFISRQDMEAVRVRPEGRPRQERETMTVYTTPTLPMHWIIRTLDGDMLMVPAIAGGWAQRKPYRGYVRGLTVVAPQSSRAALQLAGVVTA